jgi:hypothetical protein
LYKISSGFFYHLLLYPSSAYKYDGEKFTCLFSKHLDLFSSRKQFAAGYYVVIFKTNTSLKVSCSFRVSALRIILDNFQWVIIIKSVQNCNCGKVEREDNSWYCLCPLLFKKFLHVFDIELVGVPVVICNSGGGGVKRT